MKREADLVSMLGEWLEFAEGKFSEFDIDGDGDCTSEKLCPQCESNGCIQRKIRLTRNLIAKPNFPSTITPALDAAIQDESTHTHPSDPPTQ